MNGKEKENSYTNFFNNEPVILRIDNFISNDHCDSILNDLKNKNFFKAEVIGEDGKIKISKGRSNKTFIVRDIEKDYRGRQLYSVKNDLYEKKPKNIESCFFLNKVGEQAEIRKINNSMNKFTTIYKNIWRQVPANSSIDSQKQIMKNLSILINEIDFFEVNLSYNVDASINEIISNISKKIGRDGRI